MSNKKIVFYTNQFFGQIGGEEMAYQEPILKEGPVGNANAFVSHLKDAEIVATIICGDNYYAENMEEAGETICKMVKSLCPDLVIAGPAFNAGRFGIACGDVCARIKDQLKIEAITGLYEENPAVEMYKKSIYILKVAKSAAGIRSAVPLMASFANKLLKGEKIGTPNEELYFAKGQRVNVFKDKNGADRAVDMLISKLKGQAFESELEISTYEKVTPANPVKNLKEAKIALCTTGGIVPMGNPDHLPAATAKFYKSYMVKEVQKLEKGQWESVHAGFDPVYANEDPNRVAPLDVLRQLEKEGSIGGIFDYMLSTTGNSTSVADATRMGQEIGKLLLENGVSGVLLTST